MAANTADLGKLVAEAIAPTIAAYGLAIPEFYIENISLPEAVEKVLDKRTSMGIAATWAGITQYSAAEAMGHRRPPTRRAARMGVGMGAGMGMAMGNADGPGRAPGAQAPSAQQQPAPQPPPPPPPPVEHVWHIAENGQTSGPFAAAALGRMASDGSLTRETLVWTAGQDGWMQAGEVDRAGAALHRDAAPAAARRLSPVFPQARGPAPSGPPGRRHLPTNQPPRRPQPDRAQPAAPARRVAMPSRNTASPARLRLRHAVRSARTGHLTDCDHCGTTKPITSAATRRPTRMRELDFRDARCATSLPPPRSRRPAPSTCPNCGAQVEFAGRPHADRMPVLRHARRHRHRHPPPDQAARRAALPPDGDRRRARR